MNEVPIVMSTKFLGVLSNEGHVMSPHFFEKGLKINQVEPIKVMTEVMKPWLDRVAGDRPYVFQQDGAPSNYGNTTQKWCEENLSGFFNKSLWPPSSPDFNPLDYYVWGVVERGVNRGPHNNMASLKQGIVWIMESLESAPPGKGLQEVLDPSGEGRRS